MILMILNSDTFHRRNYKVYIVTITNNFSQFRVVRQKTVEHTTFGLINNRILNAK